MTASTEYKRVRAEILKLADRLPLVINEHARRQEATPQYWSFTGDLKQARLELLHVLAFLGDLEAKEELIGQDIP